MLVPILVLGLQGVVGEPAHAQDVRVRALFDGLVAYERSVEVMEWTQEVYLPPTSAMKRPRWLMSERSTRYADDQWRWFMDLSFLRTERPDFSPMYDPTVRFGDGNVRFAAGPENGWAGVSNDPDGVFIGGCSPMTLRGRWLDYGPALNASRCVSELLAAAPGLEYIEPTPQMPWPGLRAEKAVGGNYTDIEVWLDPERQCMPVRCRTARSHDGASCEVMDTLESREIQGVHVATVGTRASYCFELFQPGQPEVSEVVRGDFAAAKRLEGLPRTHEAWRAALVRAIEKVQEVRLIGVHPEGRVYTGPLAWRTEQWGPITPLVLYVHDVTLNRRKTWQDMFEAVPAHTSYMTAYTYRRDSRDECRRAFEQWTGAPDEEVR